jgi:hypothetical protein
VIIDCESCEVRGLACGNCAAPAIVAPSTAGASVITTAIVSQAPGPGHPGRPGPARGPVRGTAGPQEAAQHGGPPPDLGPAELRALRTLANAGLIAPLRYAPRVARAS